MIKFKEFNVGDADYEEQIEQFQSEHQNAEFVQITGGYTSYEKIWFKYEPSDISDSTDKLSVEKLQERCDRYEKALTEISKTKDFYRSGRDHWEEFSQDALKAQKALAAIGNEGSGDE